MEAVVSDFGFARAVENVNDVGQTVSNIGPIKWMVGLFSVLFVSPSHFHCFGKRK